MNNSPDSEEELLLKAALADHEWQALSGTLKNRSLKAFRHQHNLRRCLRVGVASAILLALAVTAWRFEHPSASPPPAIAAIAPPPPAIPQITDQQLLALFPKGTCAIAEIGGRKQLVFFDRKEAEAGYPVQGEY